jgi:hypothetical protein
MTNVKVMRQIKERDGAPQAFPINRFTIKWPKKEEVRLWIRQAALQLATRGEQCSSRRIRKILGFSWDTHGASDAVRVRHFESSLHGVSRFRAGRPQPTIDHIGGAVPLDP